MSRDVINFFAWLRSFLCLKQSGYACSAECQQTGTRGNVAYAENVSFLCLSLAIYGYYIPKGPDRASEAMT